MNTRGNYHFEIIQDGRLFDCEGNLERLRALFRDGAIIQGQWGPGDPGDFDHGSWHILCHLAGGAGALRTRAGVAWCGITYRATDDTYEASLIYRDGLSPVQLPLQGAAAKALIEGAVPLGFIEGSSLGRISARGVNDAPTAFNNWPRQKSDQPIESELDGGVVWEHWSTTRDIRPSSAIGTSVLRAYLVLLSILGGRFVSAVARGRREHCHPEQLAALVAAGVLSVNEALWDIQPDPIPQPIQRLLYRSEPTSWLEAAESLFSVASGKYFMFPRRIDRWSKTPDVRRAVASFSIPGRNPRCAALRSMVARVWTQRKCEETGHTKIVPLVRALARRSPGNSGRRCISIFAWWTPATSRSRTARRPSTVWVPRTRSRSAARNGSPCFS